MRLRYWTLALSALALLVALVAAGPAVAGKAKTRLEVNQPKVMHDFAEYSGKVKSKRARCEKGRRVTVIHDSDPPFTIGETETDENGNWKLTGPYPPSANDDTIIVKVASNRKCKSAKVVGDFYGPDPTAAGA